MRWLTLSAALCTCIAAIVVTQRERSQPGVDAAPVMNFAADIQRAAARVPSSAVRPSDAVEADIGRALAQRRQAAPDTPLAAYVERVGLKIARGAHRQLPYSFRVIDVPPMVNAFALPGGPVFIGTGLVALMDSEDELAAVLAHEVEHIDHYHCADRYEMERRLRSVPVVGAVAQLPIVVFEAGYSKAQELEADMEGTRLAYSAGYSPLGAVSLLERMARRQERPSGRSNRRARTPLDEVAQMPVSALDAYFRSHPPAAERIARIHDVVRDDRLDVSRPLRALEQKVSGGVQPHVTSR